GDGGPGKTTLATRLGEMLADDGFVVRKIQSPGFDRPDFFEAVLSAFGIKEPVRTREEFLAALGQVLDRAAAAGRHLLLIVDEAQSLGADLLDEIREISVAGAAHAPRLAVLLVGQIDLGLRLADERHAALRRRLSVRCATVPLTRDEVASYITHCLGAAGCARPIFDAGALGQIAAISRGAPR